MRALVYYVAATLDGFIARTDGSFEGFPWDDEFVTYLLATYPETFPPPFREGDAGRSENRRFDTVLMGRKTYEVGLREGLTSPYPTLDQHVFSRSMEASPDPAVTLVTTDAAGAVGHLKRRPGEDIWLCGGSRLATALLDAGLVDEVIVKLNPVIFGAGIPLFGRLRRPRPLRLVERRTFPSGHVLLGYSVQS